MNLWLLNHYALPPGMPGGTRHFDLARELTRRGCDVTIFASSFHFMEHRETRLESGETWKVEEVEGVKFVWLRTFSYQSNDWRRVVNMVSYLLRSNSMGRRLPRLVENVPAPDVIIGSSVHLLAVLSAYLLARHFGAHFLMEVRDLWPQTLVDMGALSERHLLTRLLRALERFFYRRAERIIVLLPKAKEYIAGTGICADKVHWIPNGVDLSRFSVQKPRHSTDRQFTVMYSGAHGRANALEVLLDAAGVVQNRGYPDIRFILIGDGPEKARLVAYRDKLGLRNTEFRGLVPKDKVPATLRDAEVLVLVLRDLAVYKYGVSPNKLFDYMAAGRPIVLAGDPVNNIVKEAGCGWSVPPADPEALADAVLHLYGMSPEERRLMGERGRRYVEKHHNWAVLADRLRQCIEDLK